MEPTTTVRHFAGLGEFLRAASGPSDLADDQRASRVEGFGDWYGTDAFEEALGLGRTGWIEGARSLAERKRRVRALVQLRNHLPTIEYDMHGIEPDVGRYLQGHPRCMLNVCPAISAPAGRQLITVAVNVTASSSTGPQAYKNRGAAVLAFVEAMEQSGHAVRVVAQEAVRPPGSTGRSRDQDRYQVEVLLKDHNQALDASRLAFVLCHVSFLRRLVFSLKETEAPAIRRRFDFGGAGKYGVACAPAVDQEFDVYVPAIKPRSDVDWSSHAAVTKWVAQQLTRQNVPVEVL